MISHPLFHLQLLSCPYGQLFSSRLFSPHCDAVAILTDAQLLLSCRLLTACCSHFFPHWKNIPKIFRQIWSTDQHTAQILRFQIRGPNRMVLPCSDSTMSRIHRVQVEQLLWRLLTAALRFIMGYLVLDRNFKVAS